MPATAKEPGETSRRVARNVQTIRTARRISLREMSRRLGALGTPILDTSLIRLERAERRVDVDELVTLAAVLEVTTDQLLFGEAAAVVTWDGQADAEVRSPA